MYPSRNHLTRESVPPLVKLFSVIGWLQIDLASTQLDPNLVDQLTAYAASRNVPLAQTVLEALELFMLSAAEDAWRELSSGAEAEATTFFSVDASLRRSLTSSEVAARAVSPAS